MSQQHLLHTERRWQSLILVPLNVAALAFIVGTALKGAWFCSGAFVLLALYVGTIGARLQIHRNKTFQDLSTGITPQLKPADDEELSEDELHVIAATMVRTSYAWAAFVAVALMTGGVRYYWALLAAIGVWFVAQPVGSILIALLSRPSSRGLAK